MLPCRCRVITTTLRRTSPCNRMSQPLSYSAALSGKQGNIRPSAEEHKAHDDDQQRPQAPRLPPNQHGPTQGAAFEQGRNIPRGRAQKSGPSSSTISYGPLQRKKSPDRHQHNAHAAPQTRHTHRNAARSQHTQTQPQAAESGGYTAEEYQRSSTHQANTSVEEEDY